MLEKSKVTNQYWYLHASFLIIDYSISYFYDVITYF